MSTLFAPSDADAISRRKAAARMTIRRAVATGICLLLHVVLAVLILHVPLREHTISHESVVSIELLEPVKAANPEAAPPRHHPPMMPVMRRLPQAIVSVPAPSITLTTPSWSPGDGAVETPIAVDAVPTPPPDPFPKPTVKTATEYVALLAERLAQLKQYPGSARLQRQEGTVLLFFSLDRSGKLLSWRITRPSGHPALDAEVGAMIIAATPFPPFPESMHKPVESFVVPIEFSLK